MTFPARRLSRALRGNAGPSLVAAASLALLSALVFCLVALPRGVERQLGKELAAYGANLLVLPRSAPLRFGLGALELGPVEEERLLPAANLSRLTDLPGARISMAVPGLLGALSVNGTPAPAAGYDLDALRRLSPSWRVTPGWPAAGDGLAGAALAARLHLAAGAEVRVAGRADSAAVRIAAIVETGGPEEETLLLPLELMQRLAGSSGAASLALVRAELGRASPDAVARAIEAAVPGAEARTLLQTAGAEAELLARVRRLLVAVTAALAGATAFTVSGTLGVLLAARRREIGLLVALGADPGRVRRLLLGEVAAIGAAGGLLGCALGAAAAEGIAWSVFGDPIALAPVAAPVAALAAIASAIASSALPVRRAAAAAPCDSLRAP